MRTRDVETTLSRSMLQVTANAGLLCNTCRALWIQSLLHFLALFWFHAFDNTVGGNVIRMKFDRFGLSIKQILEPSAKPGISSACVATKVISKNLNLLALFLRRIVFRGRQTLDGKPTFANQRTRLAEITKSWQG